MNEVLETLRNIPINVSVLASLFPDIKNPNIKIRNLEQEGKLTRIRKDLYVVSQAVSKVAISTELIANHLYAPSYISQLTALRYYGLIPEMVYLTQSVTLKRSKSYETPVGDFTFTQVSKESFPIGVRCEQREGYSFLIATPERALCDLIAQTPHLTLRYINETAAYLEEDIRLDMDAFHEMDKQIFRDYIAVGKKSGSIRTVLQLLER